MKSQQNKPIPLLRFLRARTYLRLRRELRNGQAINVQGRKYITVTYDLLSFDILALIYGETALSPIRVSYTPFGEEYKEPQKVYKDKAGEFNYIEDLAVYKSRFVRQEIYLKHKCDAILVDVTAKKSTLAKEFLNWNALENS